MHRQQEEEQLRTKQIAAPDGFGRDPEVGIEAAKLYRSVNGREPDYYEKASLISFI